VEFAIYGVIIGILIFVAGYWVGYEYGHGAGISSQQDEIIDLCAELAECQNTVFYQDSAIDSLRDHRMNIPVTNGYAKINGKVVDLFSHRKEDC
jgi:hypothetical protein